LEIGWWRFVLLNGVGALLYAVAFLLPGYWAHEFLAEITRAIVDFGTLAGVGMGLLVLGWLAWKIVHRQLFLRRLRGRQVHPEDLHEKIVAGDPVQVADLRQRVEFNAFPHTILGAIRLPLDRFNEQVETLARERPLVLFCT
jgi:hypothetical protein